MSHRVPATVQFATKPQIALAQIRAAKARGVPPGIVLADAAYGTKGAAGSVSIIMQRYALPPTAFSLRSV